MFMIILYIFFLICTNADNVANRIYPVYAESYGCNIEWPSADDGI